MAVLLEYLVVLCFDFLINGEYGVVFGLCTSQGPLTVLDGITKVCYLHQLCPCPFVLFYTVLSSFNSSLFASLDTCFTNNLDQKPTLCRTITFATMISIKVLHQKNVTIK